MEATAHAGRRRYSVWSKKSMEKKQTKSLGKSPSDKAPKKTAPKNKVAKKRAASRRARAGKPDGEGDVLASIAEMPTADRRLGERIHAAVRAAAPTLAPRLWYGMPAYALEGKVVCFFQSAGKFKTRYATLGFMHEAKLDDGPIWPTAFALTEWNAAVEEQVAALLRKAVG